MLSAPINVLLVDDASIIHDTLKLFFDSDPELRLTACARSGLEALHLFGRVRADILLLDLLMPGMDGFEVARLAQRAAPDLRILFFSALYSPNYAERARSLGASGWIVKDSIDDLILGIKQAAAGAPFIYPPKTRAPIAIPSIDSPDLPDIGKQALTEREKEVLRLTVESLEVKEIAARLHISVRTVETHRAHIFRKLHTRSIATLTKYAIAHGLTTL